MDVDVTENKILDMRTKQNVMRDINEIKSNKKMHNHAKITWC